MARKITLWYFEYVGNNLGMWSRCWYPTEQEAEAARKAIVDYYEREQSDETDGSYGDVEAVQCTEIELSADGVLIFANGWACGSDDE